MKFSTPSSSVRSGTLESACLQVIMQFLGRGAVGQVVNFCSQTLANWFATQGVQCQACRQHLIVFSLAEGCGKVGNIPEEAEDMLGGVFLLQRARQDLLVGGGSLVNHLAQLIQRQITHRFGEDRLQPGLHRLPIGIFPVAFFLTRFQAGVLAAGRWCPFYTIRPGRLDPHRSPW